MYAVIETGGKQYRVEPGDVIQVERLPGSEEGDNVVNFDRVLLVAGEGGIQVGTPLLGEAQVQGTLLGAVRGPKILVFKMKRRKGYRRKIGHRQDLHRVRIEAISLGGRKEGAPQAAATAPSKAKQPAPGEAAKKAETKTKTGAAGATAGKPSRVKAKETGKAAASKTPTKKAAKATGKKGPAKKATKKKE